MVFFDDIKLANKEINKYLKLEKLNNETDVYNKFLELYDTNHIVRNNVETIDNIDSVGDYLSKRPELFRELLKKKIVRWIFLLKKKKKNFQPKY